MGGLWKHMKITWITSLIGSLALIGLPFFSGFYSKDSIIEAVALSHLPGSGFAYFAVVAGVFVTAFYSFRMYFLVFHGNERYDQAPHDDHHHDDHVGKPHESPWVVWLPLVLLAIPSVVVGYIAIEPMLYGDFFGKAITIAHEHHALAHMKNEFHSATAMAIHGMSQLPFILAMAGVVVSWFFYLKRPDIPAAIMNRCKPIYTLLDNKYYFDKINEFVFAGGARALGRGLWKGGDQLLIDGLLVNGSARVVGWISALSRLLQTGHIYQYAFMMIFGVFVLLTLWVFRT